MGVVLISLLQGILFQIPGHFPYIIPNMSVAEAREFSILVGVKSGVVEKVSLNPVCRSNHVRPIN